MKFYHYEKPVSPLAKWRRQKEVSQKRLAFKLGVSRATIAMIEIGQRSPSLSLMMRISDFTHEEVTAGDFDLYFRALANAIAAEEHAQNDYRRLGGKQKREEMRNELSSSD